MMKKKAMTELTKLYTGELASIVVFLALYYWRFEGFVLPVLYPLSILCFILLQGALYWVLCLQRLKGKTIKNVGRVFYSFKYINLALIALSIPVILIGSYDNLLYTVLGFFLSLFAVVEWINYFLVRLSYKNPKILISLLRHSQLKRSKLAKEIAER